MQRRRLLQMALGGCALAVAGGAAAAAEEVELSPGLQLVPGFGGNVVVLGDREGQLLVDSGAPSATDALRARLARLTGAGRVHTLFNTHWHAAHTGGNEAFAQRGAVIHAHAATRAWLSTPYWDPELSRHEPARPPAAWPTQTFRTPGAMQRGRERIEYGHLLKAHTDSDIYVYFREANVLVAGDAVAPVEDPVLDWYAGGWLGGRVDSQARLLQLADARTRIVPGSGPVMTRAQLQAEHDLLAQLFERISESFRNGDSYRDMHEAGVLEGLPRRWNDPLRFLYAAHKGFWAHYNTLSHEIV